MISLRILFLQRYDEISILESQIDRKDKNSELASILGYSRIKPLDYQGEK